MRLDSKYFNLFITICALLTLLVIVFGTINYSRQQIAGFREDIERIRLDTLSFQSYTEVDSVQLTSLTGRPVLIHFWSTWSGKSQLMNEQIHSYQSDHPKLQILAAVVKDGEEQVNRYIRENRYDFNYVDGTPLFQELLVPGVPSQILIDKTGRLFSVHVGNNDKTLFEELDRMIAEEYE